MIYQFRKPGLKTFKGVDAQTVGDELERIRLAHDGKLVPDDVLSWAAESDSALHGCFTWDTEKAAREYNLSEARYLIKSVVVVEKEGDEPSPAFWNVSVAVTHPASDQKEQRYYQSAAVVARNPVEFESALKVMLRELASAHKGLGQLRKLGPRGTKRTIDQAARDVDAASQKLTDLVE